MRDRLHDRELLRHLQRLSPAGGRLADRACVRTAGAYPARRMRPHPLRPVLLALIALAPGACADAADRAAKARIFSPEEPPSAILRAREPLDVSAAGGNAAIWQRIWRMDRREVTERLGAHTAAADVKFRWTRAGRTVALAEEQRFETDGAGQFRARISNDQEGGLEFVWAGGQAFARSRYGEFRLRRVDRAQHDAWRDQATAAPRTVWELFDRRLRGTVAGRTTHEGRPAVKYALVLGEPLGEAEPEPDLPPVLYGLVKDAAGEKLVPGPDVDTARRLEFDRRRLPERLTGEAVLDERTGVLLRLDAKARFSMPGGDGPGATLDLDATYAVEPKPALVIEPPKKVHTPKLPHAVNKPLWFLGDDAPAAATTPAEPAEDDGD